MNRAKCGGVPKTLIGGLVLCLFVVSTLTVAAADKRAYTVDDYVKLEETGAGAADPTGRWLVWEQAPPYDQLPDYSMPGIGAWDGYGFQIMAVDLAADEPEAKALFKPDPKTNYWIDSFSPDGSKLAFYAAKDGRFSLGVYDLKRKRLRLFDAAPIVHWYNGHKSTWISNDELLFAAYPEGVEPSGLAMRRYTGDRLYAEWQKAWAGKEPTVSEVASRADGGGDDFRAGRLIRANARTGDMDVLADGLFDNLVVSADGRYLAALRQANRTQPDPNALNVDWVLARSQLTLFDLEKGGPKADTGQVIAPDKEIFPVTLAWAPDENKLAFFAWDVGAGVRSGIFQALDAETGKITPYPHTGLDIASERERGFAQKPERVMWIDGRLALLAREITDGDKTPRFTYRDITSRGSSAQPAKADWFLLDADGGIENLTAPFETISAIPIHADEQSLTLLADGDVWRVGPGREPVNLTLNVESELSHPSAVRYSTLHRPFTSVATLVGRSEGAPSFALIDLEKGESRNVASPAVYASFLAGSAAQGAVLFRHDTDDGANLILKKADGSETTVDRLNEYIADIARTEWSKIKYTVQSHVGERELESCLLLPNDYEPGKNYPVIVEIYPSRGANCLNPATRSWNAMGGKPGPYSEHLLAARGYIVFQPNTSREVTRTKDGPLGGMADIVSQGLDALVEQGYGDPERVGLLGFSQGGFSSLWLATQMDRFKAVVSLNGWSDMYSHSFEATLLQKIYTDEWPYMGSAGRYEATEGTDFAIGKSAWDDPDAYIRNSPLFQARNVTTPIMLIHSDMDSFTLAQYELFFTALYRQRKEARFLRYWGEGHGPSSPANIHHMWQSIFDWYDQYLGE